MSLNAAMYSVAQRDPKATDDGPGTAERPWKSIGAAAKRVAARDLVLIHSGTYRESVVITNSGAAEAPIRFETAPGEHVVITGADRLTGWKKAEAARPIYTIGWPHRFITWTKRMTHPDDEYHQLIGRCEQVAIDNYLLRQVLQESQMAPGTFFVDLTNGILHSWDVGNRDLNKVLVEASTRQQLLRIEGKFVHFRGVHLRFAANMAQHGAVLLAGAQNVLEDCVIESMNAGGATFSGEGHTVRRCVFRDNGQLGFGASGAHRLLFTECLVENNNTKGFDRGWEAGGDKLVLCRDAVLERSQFVRNRGSGIWFDIGNEHCTVRQCLIADNEDAGIFYEISFGLQAHDNVIVGNGFAATAGAWGAQAGVSLSSSPKCVLERNLIIGNREGFNFREQTRTTPRIGNKQEVPVWNHDELIQHNIIAFNRDAQLWGWFDVKDNRHWPAPGALASLPASVSTNSRTPNLTLKDLQLRFTENAYFASPGQGWFEWGPTWARHKSYRDLASFQNELGLDTASRVIDPQFNDILVRDFRLKREGVAQFQDCYPRGPVPGVLLGVLP